MRKEQKEEGLTRSEAMNHRPFVNETVMVTEMENGFLLITYYASIPNWLYLLSKWFFGKDVPSIEKSFQLDEDGSDLFRLIDGKRSVSEVIATFMRYHPELDSDADVTEFIITLGKRGILGINPPSDAK